MRIMIIGGGRTGYHLVKHIPRSLIIEKNPEKFRKLSELNGVKAILGDGSDEGILLNAGLKDFDAVITVTADDKTNLAVATIAKKHGVKNIIARMENPDNEKKFNSLNISAILCPTTVVADYIRELVHPKAEKEFFIKNILVPIIGPQTMEEAFEEALQISIKTDAKLILVGSKKEYLGEEEKIISILDIPASLKIEEGDLVKAIEKHMAGADLVIVDPEELSYFEKILKKSFVLRLLERFDTPILVSRVFKPYKKILLLADTLRAMKISFEMAELFGEIFHSTIELISLADSEELKKHEKELKKHGSLNNFLVEEPKIQGNLNIEVVSKVKSGDYDLTILPWGRKTFIKDDIENSIIQGAPGSVLIIKG